MNRAEALRGLFSPRKQERLESARVLESVALAQDLTEIRAAIAAERVPWVLTALRRVKVRLEGGAAPKPLEELFDEIDPEGRDGAAASSTRDTIGQVLHELTPAIGRLKIAVMSELARFSGSKTEAEFEKLGQLLDSFERWRRVNAPLRLTSVDLLSLLREIVDDDGDPTISITVVDDDAAPPVLTDRELLRAAVSNGLRNSIQAILQKGATRRGDERITVTYGTTDREFWVAINDDGVGLQVDSSEVFAAAMTTKPGHRGLGLPIARMAVEKLKGRISLSGKPDEGARLLISIPLVQPE